MRATALICGVLLCLCLPAFAQAGPIPPGNSAVDQYSETYPSSGGGEPSNGSNPTSPDKALGQDTAQKFADAGSEGQAAADLAAATAPEQQGSAANAAKTGGGSGDSGPLAVASHAVGDSDSGGMGLLLPLILAATVLGFGALVGLRIRRVRTG